MKNILDFYYNFRVYKMLSKFKRGDYLFVEQLATKKRLLAMDGMVYTIENVIWKGWFTPVLLSLRLNNCLSEYFLRLKDVEKFTVFSGILPKYAHHQQVVIDGENFEVDNVVPKAAKDWNGTPKLYFKYLCIGVEKKYKLINIREEFMEPLVVKEDSWTKKNLIDYGFKSDSV